jgi:hypothetical protein
MTQKQPTTTDTSSRTPSPAWQNLVAERNTWRTVSYTLAQALHGTATVGPHVAQAHIAFARRERAS